MTKEEWNKAIIKKCQEAGTYKPVYDYVIDTLAGIMEMKDAAEEEYATTGNAPVLTYTNKGGYTNLRKNPALVVINECNQQALAYWRDLGLTPSGYKKLNGDAVSKHDTTFEDALAKIGV